MCGIHKTPATGPEDTRDGEVPESWLTIGELRAKWQRRWDAGENYLLCNELKGEEVLVALENVIITLTEMQLRAGAA